MMRRFLLFLLLCISFNALAVPHDWQMGFQEPVTATARHLIHMHNVTMVILTIFVAIPVICMLIYVMFRFRSSMHPNPTDFHPHWSIEASLAGAFFALSFCLFLWCALPLIREQKIIPKSDMTLKVVGHQWYWSYEYGDQKIAFDSRIIADKNLKEGMHRLFSVDNCMAVPVNKDITVQVTSTDVLHSWAVPQFGVKIDAVPGRLNQIPLKVEKPGRYYGQCSELCGVGHGFMPICVDVMKDSDFKKWLKNAKVKFAT